MTSSSKITSVGQLEAASDAYLTPTVDRQLDQRVIRMVAEDVTAQLTGNTLLELGVGDRIWTASLLNRFQRVTTVDASSKLVERLAEDLREHEFRARWTSAIALFEQYMPDERFDVVLAAYVLDHLADPLSLLVRARENWLMPEGRLVLVVAHALSIHRRLAVEMGLARDVTDLGPTNLKMAQRHCFRHTQVDQLVAEAGFRILEKRGLFTKPLPNELLAQCPPTLLRGLFDLGKSLPIEYSAILVYQLESKTS